jgi:hypothetical protein
VLEILSKIISRPFEWLWDWLHQESSARHSYHVIRSCQTMVEEDGMSCAYSVRYSQYDDEYHCGSNEEIGVAYDSFKKGWNNGLKEEVFAIIHKHVYENGISDHEIKVSF